MSPLTRPEAVTLALYQLDATKSGVDTEDVADRAFAVAPKLFCWRKFPDRIDKEIVRVALSDAKLKKGWVVGSHNRGGWMLTPAGVEFARERDSGGPLVLGKSRDERKYEQEKRRLKLAEAYDLYSRAGSADAVSPDLTDEFFRITVYVTGQNRERRIAGIENEFGGDPEIGEAVRALAGKARRRE